MGRPKTPAPIAIINDPFKPVDFSHMPALKSYQGAVGAQLFYREYLPQVDNSKGSAVLVHGSSGSSESVHPMATVLAAAGVHVYALDVRGHGKSGPKGHIAFIGQLESDLQLFVKAVQPPSPSTLIGFSSGGGFALTEEAQSFLTPKYDFNLNTNFAANQDYRQDLLNAKGKVAILAGDADELLKSQELQGIVQSAGKDWPVQLLPGIGHIPLTLEPLALKAIIDMVGRLDGS